MLSRCSGRSTGTRSSTRLSSIGSVSSTTRSISPTTGGPPSQAHWYVVGNWNAVPASGRVQDAVQRGDIEWEDIGETKQVMKGVMYLDFDAETKPMFLAGRMHHVGRTGRFVPVKENCGGGILYRVSDGKLYAVTGTKGYFWKEAEQVAMHGGRSRHG